MLFEITRNDNKVKRLLQFICLYRTWANTRAKKDLNIINVLVKSVKINFENNEREEKVFFTIHNLAIVQDFG